MLPRVWSSSEVGDLTVDHLVAAICGLVGCGYRLSCRLAHGAWESMARTTARSPL